MIPVILLVIPATLLVIPVVKSGPIWSPWDRVWSYWESYSSLCLPAAPSEQGLCFFKKQEATTFHTGVVFVSSIEARFGTLWHALQSCWKASTGNDDHVDADEHASARTDLKNFEVLWLALTLCSQLGYATGKLLPLLIFQIQRLHDSPVSLAAA